MKNKWEVLVMGDSGPSSNIFEEVAKIKTLYAESKITEDEEEDRISGLEDRTEEFGLEISVIKIDNEHGHESYDWGDEDKIILWDSQGIAGNEMYTGNIQWCKDVAQLLCDKMNENNM
jgi:hypothetical protein